MMKNKILFITLILAAGLLAACGKADKRDAEKTVQEETAQDQENSEEASQEEPEQADPQSGQEEAAQEEAEQGFSFADVVDREFYFSSGAGGWYTVLYIHADGTFDGHYQDSDMGVSEPEYPNGTLYYSDFSGKFTEPEKVDDTTYAFQIDSIEYPLGFGDEIKDGYHYCYTDAYGLTGAEELYMYLPGAKIADLPEEYRSWVGYYDPKAVSETELPFYGLYNVRAETGFSSYGYEQSDAASDIEAEIQAAEEEAIALEAKLDNASSQGDMNVISGEIYKVWDDALNVVWGILKENLDEESMQKLTEEERNWIAEKEAAVKEAGAECEGGSLYAAVVNYTAAELTKERVYVLAAYLQ